jgi:uracil DNA glycosylase
MRAILDELLRAHATAGRGLVFVLWGGYAQKLRKEVEALNKKHGVAVRFVEANHPAVESFNDTNSFTAIDKALAELNEKPIDWFKRGSLDGDAAAPSGLGTIANCE